jgi:hypothetical protein
MLIQVSVASSQSLAPSLAADAVACSGSAAVCAVSAESARDPGPIDRQQLVERVYLPELVSDRGQIVGWRLTAVQRVSVGPRAPSLRPEARRRIIVANHLGEGDIRALGFPRARG